MVALLEVDVNHPFQTVARGRGEEQLRGEIRVGNEPPPRFEKLLLVADVVEVDANQSTMAHEALVLTIGENARKASEAEVGRLELLAFLHVADGPQLARHVERAAVERDEAIDFADGHRPQTPDRRGRSLVELKLSLSWIMSIHTISSFPDMPSVCMRGVLPHNRQCKLAFGPALDPILTSFGGTKIHNISLIYK